MSTDDSTSVAGASAPTTTTAMTYQHPWLGQATASTVDPAGLALKTAVSFEQPGASGWLRRLTRTLPGGTIAGAPATASVHAWGAQCERGDRASSFIATAGATASRAADQLRLDWRQFGIVDGTIAERCRFDDDSVELLSGNVADGETVLVAPLARPWVRQIERA